MNSAEHEQAVPPSPGHSVPAQLLNTSERRHAAPHPIGSESNNRSVFESLLPFIRGFRAADIVNTRLHSADFIETRAEYIALRLRFMAIFYAVAVPLWMPVDFLLLNTQHFVAIAVARLILAGFLLTLGLITLRTLSSKRVHGLLAFAVLAPCMFYAAAMLLLTQGAAEQPPAGYSFMPFLMIAMLGVFPLTLTWGGGLTAMVVLVHLVVVAFLGQWTTADAVDRLWVLLMVGGITVWIQSGQLLMLMKLYRESTEDPLTGMINRRALMKRLATEITYVSKGKPTFCILMFDLDRFKKVNDNHGHLVGDKVLKTAAKLLQGGVREHDIVARFGGEEFIAVLPESTSEEAVEVAERIRRSVEGAHVTTSDGERISLSTSVGVTAYEMPEAIEETFNRADGSLFKAKVMGRNRVVQSQSDRVPLAEPS